jgi:hypothetical protein
VSKTTWYWPSPVLAADVVPRLRTTAPSGCGAVDLAELALVELGRVERPLLDRPAAEAVALGLVAAQCAVLEVAVPDRSVDDVLGSERGRRVRRAAQRDEERDACDDQCW